MGSPWAALAPFIIATALMPLELVITLSLLGTPGRVRTGRVYMASGCSEEVWDQTRPSSNSGIVRRVFA